LDGSEASRRAVAATFDFFDAQLGPLPAAPQPSQARDILADMYGQRFAEAAKKLEPMAVAKPGDGAVAAALANAYRQSGRPGEAVKLYQKILAASPDEIAPARNLVITAAGTGDCKTAAPVAARLGDKVKDPPYLTARATCELLDGRTADAQKSIDSIVASGSSAALLHYNLACALALAGKRDEALGMLDKAVAAGWKDGEHMAKDTDLTSLRDTPRFKALLARLRPTSTN
jgi:tetratricopeptide (TPR) repeat protein